jgi:hypothetical protein
MMNNKKPFSFFFKEVQHKSLEKEELETRKRCSQIIPVNVNIVLIFLLVYRLGI